MTRRWHGPRTTPRHSRVRRPPCWRRASAHSPLSWSQQVARLEADQARARVEQQASAQAAVWAGGPERLLAAAEASSRDGQNEAAIEGFVAAAVGYQQQGHLDAALDACQRALGVSLGAPAAHLQMARIYFQRGWADRGVERLLLLTRLLSLDDDPMTREGVQALAAGAPGGGATACRDRGGWRDLMEGLTSACPGDDGTR